jgi:hypothetical protein
MIVEARDQVVITCFLPFLFIRLTASKRLDEIKGPFFKERTILYYKRNASLYFFRRRVFRPNLGFPQGVHG